MLEETVTIATADGPMEAFVAAPGAAGRAAALVVLQEAFGVNEHIREVCRRFAAEGFVALAPELYHRAGRGITVPYEDRTAIFEHLAGLTNAGLESDLRAAFGHLAARADTDPRRTGLVGFCAGGFAAFLGACRLPHRATVSFYGGGIVRARPQLRLEPVLGQSGSISAPILCLFGAEDAGIPPEDVGAIRQALDRLGVPHEVVVYPGAGHGFFNDLRASYRAEAAGDAWRRTLGWLGAHLGGAA